MEKQFRSSKTKSETKGNHSKRLKVWASTEWYEYYFFNSKARLEIPWQRGAEATQKELRRIASSLQAWQLGETSDGSHLRAAARNYAESIQDPRFIDAVDLFIKEEQRHGEDLGRFLDLVGIPRLKKNWGDRVFRLIRYSIPSMEIWVTPVIMVETIALIYYNAIRKATSSSVLGTICKQILKDEVPHIRFQYERLAILHKKRRHRLLKLTHGLHRVLFFSVVLAVWCGHHKALRAGGYIFKKYWQAAWKKMEFAWERMNPQLYEWDKHLDLENSKFQKEQPELVFDELIIRKKGVQND